MEARGCVIAYIVPLITVLIIALTYSDQKLIQRTDLQVCSVRVFPRHATQTQVQKTKIRMLLEGQNVEVEYQHFP